MVSVDVIEWFTPFLVAVVVVVVFVVVVCCCCVFHAFKDIKFESFHFVYKICFQKM